MNGATLAKAMAADVLEQLSLTRGLSGTLVVTSDADAHALAANFGASVAGDPIESGINAAVQLGIRTLSRLRGEPAIIVVPADIPFVTAAELSEVITALDDKMVVLAEAARDGGTNIIGLSPPNIIATAFGPDSFAKHVSHARAVGVEPLILTLKGAGHDVDVSSDLFLNSSLRGGPRTLACLASFRHFSARRQPELVKE